MDQSENTNAYHAGIACYELGGALHLNPYGLGSIDRLDWKRGWEDAQRVDYAIVDPSSFNAFSSSDLAIQCRMQARDTGAWGTDDAKKYEAFMLAVAKRLFDSAENATGLKKALTAYDKARLQDDAQQTDHSDEIAADALEELLLVIRKLAKA